MKKKPVYKYQCIVCRENFYTENAILKHCGRLTEWIEGIEGKGINMSSPMVKIKVSGYIKMNKENLDRLLEAYKYDAHYGILQSISMGYVNASNLDFEIE